jgi:FHA domain
MELFEIVMLILRVGLVMLLFFFIVLVVNTINSELTFSRQRANVMAKQAAQSQAQMSSMYPAENFAPQPSPAYGNQTNGKLLVTEIGNATTVQIGNVFELKPVTPIGRRNDNVIILNDDYVSTEHALLAFRDGFWWLSDVASTNGTFVNNRQVTRPTALQWGDLVGIGRVKMRLEP